jgi:cytoplasmic FMR1 interacting protein
MTTNEYSDAKAALEKFNESLKTDSEYCTEKLESAAAQYSSSAFFHLQSLIPATDSYESRSGPRDARCYVDNDGAHAKILYEDFQHVAKLKGIVARSDEIISFLYSHRSLSPCLPKITDNRKDQSESIYGAWVTILSPFVDQLSNLFQFAKSSVDDVQAQMSSLLQLMDSGTTFSAERLWQLARAIDRLYVVDSLKGVKASINNDFSAYKRALQSAVADKRPQDWLQHAQQHMELGQFLANKGSILKMLMDKIFLVRNKSKSFVHLIAELLRYTVPALSATVSGGSADGAERHLLPSDRHSLLRIVPLCIVLLGPDEKDVRDLLHDKGSLGKELQLQKTLKDAVEIFKLNPVGLLFADTPFVVHSVLLEAVWFPKLSDTYMSGFINASELPQVDTNVIAQRYDVREHLQRLRRQYAMALARYQCLTLALEASHGETGETWNPELLEEGYTATMDMLKALAALSALTIEQAAWKCCRPASGVGVGTISEDEEPILRYDKMVKLNYQPSELDAILEIMSMSFNLSSCLRTKLTLILSVVKRYMHSECQRMVQERLTGMIAHAAKKKKQEVLDMVTILRKVYAILAC